MKKTYINPKMTLVSFDSSDIIVTSELNSSMPYGGTSVGGKAEGQSRSGGIWDEE